MIDNLTSKPTSATVQGQKAKEAYFTASQRQLVWARFKKQRAAMVAAGVLIVLIVLILTQTKLHSKRIMPVKHT